MDTPPPNPGAATASGTFHGVINKKRKPGLTQDFTVKRVAQVKRLGSSTNTKKKAFAKTKLNAMNNFVGYLQNRRPAVAQIASKRVTTPWQNLDMTLTGGSSLNEGNVPPAQDQFTPRPAVEQMLPPVDMEESAFAKRLRKATSTPKREPAKPVKRPDPQSRVYSRVVEVSPNSKAETQTRPNIPTPQPSETIQRQQTSQPIENPAGDSQKDVSTPQKPEHRVAPVRSDTVQPREAEKQAGKPHPFDDASNRPARSVQRIEEPAQSKPSPEKSLESRQDTPAVTKPERLDRQESPREEQPTNKPDSSAKPDLPVRQQKPAPIVAREMEKPAARPQPALRESVQKGTSHDQPGKIEPTQEISENTQKIASTNQREPTVQREIEPREIKKQIQPRDEVPHGLSEKVELEKPLVVDTSRPKKAPEQADQLSSPPQKPVVLHKDQVTSSKPEKPGDQRQPSTPVREGKQPEVRQIESLLIDLDSIGRDDTPSHQKTAARPALSRSRFKPIIQQNRAQRETQKTAKHIPFNYVQRSLAKKETPQSLQRQEIHRLLNAEQRTPSPAPAVSQPVVAQRAPVQSASRTDAQPRARITARRDRTPQKEKRIDLLISTPLHLKARESITPAVHPPITTILRHSMQPGVLHRQQEKFENTQVSQRPTRQPARTATTSIPAGDLTKEKPAVVAAAPQTSSAQQKPAASVKRKTFGVLQRQRAHQDILQSKKITHQAFDHKRITTAPALTQTDVPAIEGNKFTSQPQKKQHPFVTGTRQSAKIPKTSSKPAQSSTIPLEEVLEQLGIGSAAGTAAGTAVGVTAKRKPAPTQLHQKPEMPVLQSQPVGVGSGIVQRESIKADTPQQLQKETEQSEPIVFEWAEKMEEKPQPPNLSMLAKQIFPIIRRMLALEKERSSGR